MMEYTKGEWEIAHYESGILEGVNFIRSADKQEVSICTISSTNESSEANAQLIAASPDMYEALKMIEAKYDRCVICKNLKETGHDYNCPIMQALAKAEGK